MLVNKRTGVYALATGTLVGGIFPLVALVFVEARSTLTWWVFYSVCVTLGLALGWGYSRLAAKLEARVLRGVFDQARSELSFAVGQGEGELRAQMLELFTRASRSVSRVESMSEELRALAAELLAVTEEQASGAAQQAAAVAQTSATVEELAQTSKQIAENSESVASIAELTLESAQEGMQALENTAAGIEEIRMTTQVASDRILELGERSQEIGRVLVIIDDIAEQTKILALNAAIEAARAGDAGKGFAVVAEEIRKLAESVTRSTQDIGRVVHEIQSSAGSLIMSTERAQTKVEEGKSLAAQTAEALFRIVTQVGETTSSAKQISIATQQQRSASDQVVVSMREMSQVASSAARSSRDVQQTIGQLRSLADGLGVRE